MEVKEQPNQNPDTVQEEKPNPAEKAAEENVESITGNNKNKAQINPAEKQQIVDLLKGKTAEASAGPSPEKSKEATPQLGKEEKETIVKMLRDERTLVEAEEPPAEKEEHQISKAERREIIALLGGKPSGKAAKVIRKRVDYDRLNKQELVEILEQVVEEKDILKIKDDVARIKVAFYNRNNEDINREREQFIEQGGDPATFKTVTGPLEHRFNAAFGKYKRNKAKFSEEMEKQKQENLILKNQILEDLKKLIDSEETLKKTYDEFKILQTRWKEIGMVPASELRNLWQNYHFLVERFFDKVKINKELRDLDMRKNMELKIALCEKAEALLLEKSIVKSFKLLQKYHDQWREIGPVPTEYKEDLWERFKASTHKINQRRKEYYRELQDEQQRNYEAKVAMCEKLEELLEEWPETLRGWNQQTDRVNDLLRFWKTIGRAPRVQNDEIWARFKASLDRFFESKREFLSKLKEQQTNNYNLKLNLCVQAEALKDSEDWAATTNALINMQKEWKEVGPVSRRQADKIWKRFRAACDHFFNRKKEHFKSLHSVEDDNLKTKQALVEEIKAFKVLADKKANLEALKSFQTRWMETGHVPFREKDKIQAAYREAIDQLINLMDINKQELSATGFQSKVDLIKHAPDAGRRLSKERNFIAGKIRTLQENLIVLENNIGFFSNSEQSNLLKQGFEKKIEKAKKEIKDLQEKLRILDA